MATTIMRHARAFAVLLALLVPVPALAGCAPADDGRYILTGNVTTDDDGELEPECLDTETGETVDYDDDTCEDDDVELHKSRGKHGKQVVVRRDGRDIGTGTVLNGRGRPSGSVAAVGSDTRRESKRSWFSRSGSSGKSSSGRSGRSGGR